MKFAFRLILLFFLTQSYLSQTVEELHSKIRSDVAERKYAEAIKSLNELEQTQPDIFAWNNYDYLLARIMEKTGNTSEALVRYQSVVKRNSILRSYALFHVAAIAKSSGNLMLERKYLEELTAFAPDSLMVETARNRIARSLFESGNYDLARRAFESLRPVSAPTTGKTRTDDPVARENRLLLARCLLLTGNAAAARENFVGLISSLANAGQPDDFALAAVKELDKLDLGAQAGETKAPALNDYEHLQRASIYQFNRNFADARLHYAAIINNHPASGIVPDALFQTGRGYVQETNYSEAAKWFERTVEQFPEHQSAKDALLQAASVYARLGKHREAIRRYQDYIAKYPTDERVDRAYLNIIDVLRDEGEEIEAQKWAAKVQETFRGKLPEAQALFAEARIHIARSNWDEALKNLERLSTLSDLGGTTVPGGTSKTEVAFLRAFVLEQKRSFAEAIAAYLEIPDGRAEYYGWRATERMLALANDETAKTIIRLKFDELTHTAASKEPEAGRRNIQSALRLTSDPSERERLLGSLTKTYSNSPSYRKLPALKKTDTGSREIINKQPSIGGTSHKALADELIFLGLLDEAAPEFDAAMPGATAANDLNYTKAMLYMRGDRAHRTIAFIEPLWKNVPADFQVELIPREMAEMLYPAPYADAFAKYAVPRSIDSRFLLSLVRQESRYRPDVKSYAAARGLMQFITTTAEKIASELGRANFDQDELYDPSTAILFGSQYTSNLFKMFPNQPQAVAASYNGGEDNMKRWMKRSKSEMPDRYVPEIAFSQSKDYVYKVMANYRVYKMFYDERPAIRQGF